VTRWVARFVATWAWRRDQRIEARFAARNRWLDLAEAAFEERIAELEERGRRDE
jgi:hypothetical protein